MAIVIPYAKQSWTDGSSSGSAARFGVLEEGVLDVSQAPAVRVFHNATQAITTATDTALAFNSERYDQAGGSSSTMHDTVTNNSRLTAIYAGIYSIKGLVLFAASSSGTFREASIRVNGTTVIADDLRFGLSASLAVRLIVAADYSLAVNDYVELVVRHDVGSNLNVSVVSNTSPEFMMHRVG